MPDSRDISVHNLTLEIAAHRLFGYAFFQLIDRYMDRKTFLRICSILGISIPFQTVLASTAKEGLRRGHFGGKVAIIGAGAAGMTAGYLLKQLGIDFELLLTRGKTTGGVYIMPQDLQKMS